MLAKTTKHAKKTQKNNNLLKTTRILNTKMSAKGCPVFTFSLLWGRLAPCLPPRQLRYCSSLLQSSLFFLTNDVCMIRSILMNINMWVDWMLVRFLSWLFPSRQRSRHAALQKRYAMKL